MKLRVLGYTLPTLGYICAIALVLSMWSSAPDPMAVHWGLDGQPDRWEPRDATPSIAPLVYGIASDFLLLGLAVFIGRAGPQHRLAYYPRLISTARYWLALMISVAGSLSICSTKLQKPLVMFVIAVSCGGLIVLGAQLIAAERFRAGKPLGSP